MRVPCWSGLRRERGREKERFRQRPEKNGPVAVRHLKGKRYCPTAVYFTLQDGGAFAPCCESWSRIEYREKTTTPDLFYVLLEFVKLKLVFKFYFVVFAFFFKVNENREVRSCLWVPVRKEFESLYASNTGVNRINND